MKTCYGGHCYEYKEGGAFRNVVSSSLNIFLVVVAIVVTLVAATGIFNEFSVVDYLNNGFITNFPYSDFTP